MHNTGLGLYPGNHSVQYAAKGRSCVERDRVYQDLGRTRQDEELWQRKKLASATDFFSFGDLDVLGHLSLETGIPEVNVVSDVERREPKPRDHIELGLTASSSTDYQLCDLGI